MLRETAPRTLYRPARGRALSALLLAAVCVSCLLSGAFAVAARAVPPSPELLKRAARDEALAARLQGFEERARQRGVDKPLGRQAAPSPAAGGAQRAASATGSLKTLALLVDFADRPATVAASWFNGFLFADVFGPASLRGYFREVSYGSPTEPGLLDVVTANLPGDVGWLRLPQNLSYYAAGDYGIGAYPGNAQRMVEDAIAAADPFVDFSVYDNDGDGYVDNLFVIHAGRGAELTGAVADIWSHQWETSQPVSADGVFVSTYSTEPEYWSSPGDMTVGVYAHEMGHVLGLVDLYDRDLSSAGVGAWSLMGSGSWNGARGDSPARPDAWSAARLGWLEPVVVGGEPAQHTLAAVGASATQSAVKVFPRGREGGEEYFLFENRQKTGTDAALPGHGLLIWHVDEGMLGADAWNDDETHKLVDLEEAGGFQTLDFSSWEQGGADDPFPGSASMTAFDDGTVPNARIYGGWESCVVAEEIAEVGQTVTLRVGVADPADGTPPAVTASGATNGGWYRRDRTITLSAVDDAGGSGVTHITYSLDGAAAQVVAGERASVLIPVEPNTRHVLTYRAEDAAGNVSTERVFRLTTDSVGPRGYGRDVRGTRGRTLSLPYKLTDLMSPRFRSVHVVIRTRSGKLARSIWVPSTYRRLNNVWYRASWRPAARGTYRYWVYGRDLAGNPQRARGYGVIRVR